MNTKTTIVISVLLALAFPRPTRAAGTCHWVAAPGAKLRLNGDSTLHPYYSETHEVAVEADSAPVNGRCSALDLAAPNALRAFRAKIPIRALKSESDGLDDNLRKALDAERFPELVFELASYRSLPKSTEATGKLSIHGKTREETLDLELASVGGGLRVKGSKNLKMTDFGVEPPTMFLGTIRTQDEIRITFELTLVPQPQNGEKK